MLGLFATPATTLPPSHKYRFDLPKMPGAHYDHRSYYTVQALGGIEWRHTTNTGHADDLLLAGNPLAGQTAGLPPDSLLEHLRKREHLYYEAFMSAVLGNGKVQKAAKLLRAAHLQELATAEVPEARTATTEGAHRAALRTPLGARSVSAVQIVMPAPAETATPKVTFAERVGSRVSNVMLSSRSGSSDSSPEPEGISPQSLLKWTKAKLARSRNKLRAERRVNEQNAASLTDLAAQGQTMAGRFDKIDAEIGSSKSQIIAKIDGSASQILANQAKNQEKLADQIQKLHETTEEHQSDAMDFYSAAMNDAALQRKDLEDRLAERKKNKEKEKARDALLTSVAVHSLSAATSAQNAEKSAAEAVQGINKHATIAKETLEVIKEVRKMEVVNLTTMPHLIHAVGNFAIGHSSETCARWQKAVLTAQNSVRSLNIEGFEEVHTEDFPEHSAYQEQNAAFTPADRSGRQGRATTPSPHAPPNTRAGSAAPRRRAANLPPTSAGRPRAATMPCPTPNDKDLSAAQFTIDELVASTGAESAPPVVEVTFTPADLAAVMEMDDEASVKLLNIDPKTTEASETFGKKICILFFLVCDTLEAKADSEAKMMYVGKLAPLLRKQLEDTRPVTILCVILVVAKLVQMTTEPAVEGSLLAVKISSLCHDLLIPLLTLIVRKSKTLLKITDGEKMTYKLLAHALTDRIATMFASRKISNLVVDHSKVAPHEELKVCLSFLTKLIPSLPADEAATSLKIIADLFLAADGLLAKRAFITTARQTADLKSTLFGTFHAFYEATNGVAALPKTKQWKAIAIKLQDVALDLYIGATKKYSTLASQK